MAKQDLNDEEKVKAPKELTDRKIYNTPIGPVCMSKTEHEEYLEELELRNNRKKRLNQSDPGV